MSMRSIILVALLGITLAFVAFGLAEKPEDVRVREETRRVQRLQTNANVVVNDIQYIKDTRTHLCFAYYWGGEANGGPALATVPCEVVPLHLLTAAN